MIAIITKIVESVYADMLPDYSEKEIAGMAREHRLNNPELYGYVWDEKNGDWVFNRDGFMQRIIDRTGKKTKTSK
jgi:hypothetical protein